MSKHCLCTISLTHIQTYLDYETGAIKSLTKNILKPQESIAGATLLKLPSRCHLPLPCSHVNLQHPSHYLQGFIFVLTFRCEWGFIVVETHLSYKIQI